MRLATWNVNSLNARMPRVEEWLDYASPDILCLQETKLTDEAFPTERFAELGYESVHHGSGRWNGVAILSRIGLTDSSYGFGDDDPYASGECRLLSARCGSIVVLSVYVPNGREVGSEYYEAKLLWLSHLQEYLAKRFDPMSMLAVCGDFNIAPTDKDLWDPAFFEGHTHVTEPERRSLEELLSWGLVDVFRLHRPESGLYSWWDYRGGDFHQHRGMRIDLILTTESLAKRSRWVLIDRNARKGRQPSDHAPVVVDFDL
ncbi:MAG: exodeoxyribonuclease III [Actinobacteria bacterium]|nr:exodeoxyribonuclease III [Actinomycetota bacterium]MCL6095368.1 exodeoxyribonuclease III [Actinomycetota bacterium]